MSKLVEKLRELSQMDLTALLERLKNSQFHRSQWMNALDKFYGLLIPLSLLGFLVALTILLWPLPSKKAEESHPVSYSFAQAAQNRVRVLSAFSSRGGEGRDPLWIELRTNLDFLGVNARPDNSGGRQARFRWLTSNSELKVNVGQTLYFAPHNGQWIRVEKSRSPQLAIKLLQVELRDHSMQAELEILRLKQNQFEPVETVCLVREIGKKSLEQSQLLALTRMGCRWWGPDLFLLNHSGSDARELTLTQRIEIGHGAKMQTLYLSPGHAIIHQGQEFISQRLGTATQGQVIWVIDKLKEDKLDLEAWSSTGEHLQPLSIARQAEPWQPRMVEAQMQLAGVRGKEQIMLQIQQERWNLKVSDWLLHTASGWQKIRSAEQVDQFVTGVLKGELLILREMHQEATGGWVASFRLYSPARSLVHDFELKASATGAGAIAPGDQEESPSPDQLRDPDSHFKPMKEGSSDATKWPQDEERAWQPPAEISPQKMLEILKGLNNSAELQGEPKATP